MFFFLILNFVLFVFDFVSALQSHFSKSRKLDRDKLLGVEHF